MASDNLIQRLRERVAPSIMLTSLPPQPAPDSLCREAAAEIERLRAKVAYCEELCTTESICIDKVRKDAREEALEDAADLVSSITTEMTASEVAEAIRRLA